jgi:hypothetical protein
MKAAMLFFFHRLTVGLWQHKWIKWIGLVCGVTYLAVFLTITLGCPFQQNWQVEPDPGEKCTLKLQNFLVTVTLNVITDFLILAVPVPLLWTLQVPIRRKIVISLLLCSGMFVIAAAIIRVALTLDSNPSATNINRWGVRETIVGIVTINAPILRPMFTRKFWSREEGSLSYGTSRNLDGGKSGGGGVPSGKGYELSSTICKTERGSDSSGHKSGAWETSRELSGDDVESGVKRQRRVSGSTMVSVSGSEEYIMQSAKRNNEQKQEMGMEVNVQTEFSVRSEHVGEVASEDGQREEQWQRGHRAGAGSRAGVR